MPEAAEPPSLASTFERLPLGTRQVMQAAAVQALASGMDPVAAVEAAYSAARARHPAWPTSLLVDAATAILAASAAPLRRRSATPCQIGSDAD